MASWVWPALVAAAIPPAVVLLQGAKPRAALGAGAFLAAVDLAVENAGGMLGWWQTHQVGLAVGVTPVEILVVAALAGASLGPFLARVPASRIRSVAGLALGGVALEQLLSTLGLLTYAGPWNPLWAFLAYVAALWLTAEVHDRLAARRPRAEPPDRPVPE